MLLSGQERVKPPFPLKASPVQVLARGPAQAAGVSPGPSRLPQDPPEPRLSIALRCSVWTAPKGRAAPRSTVRLSRSRNSFYCQKLGPVKGPYPQQGQGQPAPSVSPIHGEPCWVLSLQPGQSWCQELGLKLVLSPFPHGWVRKRMCLTLSPGALLQCHFWVPRAPLGPGQAQDISPLVTTLSSPRRCSFSTRFQLKMLLLPGGLS